MCQEIHGRKVTLARVSGRLFCFDSVCYHMGGPLSEGDIEDFGGKACVTCPWHGHKVCAGSWQVQSAARGCCPPLSD